MTKEERARILQEARSLLKHTYVPPTRRAEPPPLVRKRYDGPQPEPAPARWLDTAPPQPALEADPWAGWEQWLETRLEARLAEEREQLLQAIIEITGTALGESLKAEREESGRELNVQMRELKLENAKLQHALQHLGELIQLEKNRTIDLRPLPARGIN
jgi:hypothetical protein